MAESASVKPEFAASEMARVLELGALVPEQTPEGTRFAWSE